MPTSPPAEWILRQLMGVEETPSPVPQSPARVKQPSKEKVKKMLLMSFSFSLSLLLRPEMLLGEHQSRTLKEGCFLPKVQRHRKEVVQQRVRITPYPELHLVRHSPVAQEPQPLVHPRFFSLHRLHHPRNHPALRLQRVTLCTLSSPFLLQLTRKPHPPVNLNFKHHSHQDLAVHTLTLPLHSIPPIPSALGSHSVSVG